MVVVLAALGLLLHGLLHLVGFMVPWSYAGITVLRAEEAAGGRLRLGDGLARVLGLLWLLMAALYILAATGLLFGVEWAVPLVVVATVGSLPLCLAKLPEMAVGAAIDVVILVLTLPILITGSPLVG